MKLAILGGGGFRTPMVWQALLRDVGSPRVTEVALYDVDAVRLATMTAILSQLAVGFPDPPTLRSHTTLEPAVEGADFIFAALGEELGLFGATAILMANTPSAIDTSRYAPSPWADLPTRAAMIAITACMPPAAMSATVAPGSGGPPSARGVEQCRYPPAAR